LLSSPRTILQPGFQLLGLTTNIDR
jgi:hypothetical protein